jgi:hypothetical protein
LYNLPASPWTSAADFAKDLCQGLNAALSALQTPLPTTPSSGREEPSDDAALLSNKRRGASKGSDEDEEDDGQDDAADRTPHNSDTEQATGATLETTLAAVRSWLMSTAGISAPLELDHLVRGATWLPKEYFALTTMSGTSRLDVDRMTAESTLWAWRAVRLASPYKTWGLKYDDRTRQFVVSDGGAGLPTVVTVPLVNGAAPLASPALTNSSSPVSLSPISLTSPPITGGEENADSLLQRHQQLSSALQQREAVAAAAATASTGASKAAAAVHEPRLVWPRVLLPDTNVFLKPKHFAALQDVVGGKFESLSIAVPLVVLDELTGIATDKSETADREAGVKTHAVKVLAYLEREVRGWG